MKIKSFFVVLAVSISAHAGETAIGTKTWILALQLHAGEPMTVKYKEIVLTTKNR